MAEVTNVRHAGRLIPIGVNALFVYVLETAIRPGVWSYNTIIWSIPSGKELVNLRFAECKTFPLTTVRIILPSSIHLEVTNNIRGIVEALEAIRDELAQNTSGGSDSAEVV